MKRFLLATVSMVALTSVTRAADMPAAMPAKGPMYLPVSVASWDGPYVGVQGGVVRQNGSLKNFTFDFVSAGSKTGGTIGALAGYNWQQRNFVYGLEGDWSWIGAKATHLQLAATTTTYDINWLATARARVGLAHDLTLFYLTGGVAFGHVNNSFAFVNNQGIALLAYTDDRTKAGWVAGAGVEHEFSPHWTARGEFRYVNFGKTNAGCVSNIIAINCGVFPPILESSNTLWMGLVGVNYKFGSNPTGDWSQARAYEPDSIQTWGGGYLAVQGGFAGHSASFSDPDGFLTGNPDLLDQRKAGGTIGGLLGYNWQQGSFVYGVEGDWSWVGAKSSRFVTAFDFDGNSLSTSYEVNWLATLRGRAGLAIDATLLYVTGGLALGHVKNDVEVIDGVPDGRKASFTQNQTRVGWTAGVGVEHMFSRHWTARAEFRYVDLGTTSVACSSATNFHICGSGNYRGTFSNTLMLGLVGLAYKF